MRILGKLISRIGGAIAWIGGVGIIFGLICVVSSSLSENKPDMEMWVRTASNLWPYLLFGGGGVLIVGMLIMLVGTKLSDSPLMRAAAKGSV